MLAVSVAIATVAHAQNSRPDPRVTPGAINPAVTPNNIHETICARGWTKTIRPPESYTYRLKRMQFHGSGAPGRIRDYEEDHLVPLELAGAPEDPRNLWLEPWNPADGWDAGRKDVLERRLHRLVCAGQLPLMEAQTAIAQDWIAAYLRYVGKRETSR